MRPALWPLVSSAAILFIGAASTAQVGNQVESLEITNRHGVATGSITVRGPGVQMPGPLKGEPYSADQESEHSQTLADGTHIRQKRSIARMYRDFEGRTRTERNLLLGPGKSDEKEGRGLIVVHIYDPVDGYSYTLDTQRRIAHRFPVEVPASHSSLNRPTRTMSAFARAQVPEQLVNEPHLRGRTVNGKSLGTRLIDGVQVEGVRITITTPAEAEGNDRPIVRVCDRWHSQELDLTLVSKCSDPRSGSTRLRMRNLDRSEPDPLLFQVPSDYTIVDEHDRFSMSLGEP